MPGAEQRNTQYMYMYSDRIAAKGYHGSPRGWCLVARMVQAGPRLLQHMLSSCSDHEFPVAYCILCMGSAPTSMVTLCICIAQTRRLRLSAPLALVPCARFGPPIVEGTISLGLAKGTKAEIVV